MPPRVFLLLSTLRGDVRGGSMSTSVRSQQSSSTSGSTNQQSSFSCHSKSQGHLLRVREGIFSLGQSFYILSSSFLYSLDLFASGRVAFFFFAALYFSLFLFLFFFLFWKGYKEYVMIKMSPVLGLVITF